jgi:hypothetical protein
MFVSQIYDECAEILGTTDDKKIFRKIQQAVATLMESGHWTHSVADVDVCTGWDRCSITLPRNIDVPLAVNIDGSPAYFRNRLFQYHVNKGGMFNSVEWAWDDRGYVATLMDIIQPSQLVAVAEMENDVGKTIRVLGIDENNRTIRSQLANGTGVDGLLIPIHSQSDFAYGTIIPDDATIKTRSAAITPINMFKSVSEHGLSSGQGMSVTTSGTIPVALENGQVYYIGVIDAFTVQLFNDPLNAQALDYPINLQSIVGAGSLEFKDSRDSQVVTALELSSAPAFTLDTANQITFPTGQSLPSPINSQTTYYANAIDSTHLTVFESENDAKKNINPVYTTGTTGPVPPAPGTLNVDIRKKIDPQTTLTFPVRHYYNDGDQVQAFTASGNLPQPLIANQNYYVNVIDQFTISLHISYADAIASDPTNLVNPIILKESGSGTNSIVKLLPATVTIGTSSQITAPGLNIPTPSGSGAQFQAVTVGSVVSVQVTAGGSGYSSAPSVTFSDPPSQPPGSTIATSTAIGYAIIVSGAVNQVVITNAGLGYVDPPAITFSGTGGATATATIQKSFVSSFKKISGGIGYTEPPQVKITGGGGSGATATATINNAVLSVPNISVVSGEAVVTTSSPHNYDIGQAINIAGVTGTYSSNFNGQQTITFVDTIDTLISTITKVGTLVTVVTSAAHNYSTGDIIRLKNVTPASYTNTPFVISVYDGTTFTFNTTNASTPVLASGAASYVPNPASTTFKFTTSVPNGTIVNNLGITSTSGDVTSLNVVTTGTGYTSIPTVTITPSTGVFIAFTSTGVLPSPLVSGTAYRAEAPLNTSTGNFTVKGADFSDVNITSSGTGTFYVSLSRPFSVTFNNNWAGDFANLVTGQEIYWGTDYLLPNTNPPIDNGVTPFYLNKINNTTGKIYNTQVNANAGLTSNGSSISITSITSISTTATVTTASNHGYVTGNTVTITGASPTGYNKIQAKILSTPALNQFTYTIDAALGNSTTGSVYKTSGLVIVNSFGSGQSYYALRKSFQSLPYGNLITPSTIEYLNEDEIVKFSTTNALPLPLTTTDSYTIKLFGDSFKVYLGGVLQNLTTSGSGQLKLDIIRTFNVSPSTSIDADQSQFNTGDAVVPRAKEGDVLPTGLTSGTTYYARRVDNNSFELYDTQAQSKNTSSTTGRRSYTTTGELVTSTFFIDSVTLPVFVKSVAQIDKPITEGYVSLYAYDYGRSNDMTLIGQYHPSEVNPQYRRIRIGKPCAWARISYRIQAPSITSIYDFVPLEQERAIITAVHAVDLEDKDFADQSARYWQIAFAYLKNQQESIDGHAMVTPQINAITYGDTTDPVMF